MSDRELAEEYPPLMRGDFCSFVARCFAELNPGSELTPGGHIEVMASRLTAVQLGQIPPTHH